MQANRERFTVVRFRGGNVRADRERCGRGAVPRRGQDPALQTGGNVWVNRERFTVVRSRGGNMRTYRERRGRGAVPRR